MSDIKKDNLKYALSYVPLVAFFFFFTEKKPSAEFKKHINYGMLLFGIYVILSWVFKAVLLSVLSPLLFLVYIVFSVFLGLKAYKGEEVQVDILDNIEDKIKDNFDKK